MEAGCTIEVFGRKFQVLGCDQFTQRYYKEAYEVDFPLAQLGGEDEDYNVGMKDSHYIEFQVPPYNHFGNEEDSLSNCYRLVPKPAKKDYFKWVDNQIQLRFTAVMNAKRPEDFGRRFVITFYLNDDNLMIYEPVQRNSGIVSGKFLEKGKYKNVQGKTQT